MHIPHRHPHVPTTGAKVLLVLKIPGPPPPHFFFKFLGPAPAIQATSTGSSKENFRGARFKEGVGTGTTFFNFAPGHQN